jgi:hypothetical protein
MKFTQWLESQINDSKIKFGSFFTNGTVTVYINGKRYVYITDASYHNDWDKKLEWIGKHKPQAYQKVAFSFLNQIKDMVKNGRATQIEPKPL